MDWLSEYFINPVLMNGWFNPVNTLAYGIILVVAVYLVFRMLRKLRVSIDRYFIFAVLPFIFWGSSTRVLHDAAFAGKLAGSLGNFYSLPVFPTPGSYMITFLLALLVLLFSLLIQRRFGYIYWKIMFSVGLALCLVNVAMTPFSDLFAPSVILGLSALWGGLFYLIGRFSEKMGNGTLSVLFSKENVALLSSHMLDASATWTALTFYGYVEQHVVPRMIIPFLGPASMFLLKLAVLIPVLFLVDRYTEEGNFRNFLKLVILILGLAPGMRNLLRLAAGV